MKKLLIILLLVPSLLAAQVTFIDQGAGGPGITNGVNVPYPVTVAGQAGDLLIACIAVRSIDLASLTFTTPAGWTNYSQPTGTETLVKLLVYYKIADGTETGNLTVTITGTTDSRASKMYRFRGQAATNFLASNGEAVTVTTAYSVTHPVTPVVGVNDLAVWISAKSDDGGPSVQGAVTATGGTWNHNFTQRYGTTQGSDSEVNMLYATGSGTTISGGSYAFASSPDEFTAISLVIKAGGGGTPPPTGTKKGFPPEFFDN